MIPHLSRGDRRVNRRAGRLALCVVLCVALCAGYFANAPTVQADTGINWTGSYYANPALQGAPVFTRIDPAVVFNWGQNSPGPGLGSQYWSARWDSVQYFNAGTYRFRVTSDDGVRVYVDGQNILDAWHDQAATTYYVNVQVVAGNHSIEVQYYQGLGDAQIAVSWDLFLTPSTAWTAQYFNNPYLDGAPTVTRYENEINYFWGFGSPDPYIVSQNFSARWTATLPFSAATYRFTLAGDDGVRLFIDDVPIINQWHDQVLTAYSIDLSLAAGLHTVRVEYYQHTGQAAVRFNYEVAIGPPPYGGYLNTDWYAEYYANTSLAGSPNFVRQEGQSGVLYDWSFQSPVPGLPSQNYSVRWTRQVCVPGRPYLFYLAVDDGARFYIDTTLIIDAWKLQSRTTYTRYVNLTNGCHIFRLEYFQATLNAYINLTWNPPDGQNPPLYFGGSPQPASGVIATVQYASLLNVRTGPGLYYDILTQVAYSQQLQVIGRNFDNSWYHIITPTGVDGWVYSAYTVITQGNLATIPVQNPSLPPPTVITSGVRGQARTDVRVRGGPSTIYEQIDGVPFGSIIDVIGRTSDNTWLQIRYGDTTGWVYGPYILIVSGYLNALPVTG